MKLTCFSLLACIISVPAMAQQHTKKETTVTLAALFSSDVSYYGQTTDDKLPYVLANATVRFPIGIHLSAGSYKLLNYGTGVSETDLGAGFTHEFNDVISAGISYTRSFFPSNSPLLQASNENNLNLSAVYTWPWLKSSVSADYAFGLQTDVFLSFNHSKEIDLGTLFSEQNTLSIEPAFELIAGSRHFLETYYTELAARDKKNGKPKKPEKKGNQPSEVITTTVSSTNFNLLSYNFKLPVCFSRGNYLAEVSYQLSVPGAHAVEELKKPQSFFGLACYYQF